MSRRYQDEVEVRLGDPVEHRVHLEPGWQRNPRPEVGPVPTQFLWQGRVHLVRGVLAQWSRRTSWWREPGRTDALEHQVWRVEATAGRSLGSGVYDLVHDEQWLLERVSD